MTISPTVARMKFSSTEDQNRAIRDIILRQHRATPPAMGRGREALMNGIEACNRAAALRKQYGVEGPYKPTVYVGPHPTFTNLFCIADNGCGMTFQEAERHLASIGNSGNSAAVSGNTELYKFDTNKGVGVKISLLPDNPGGLDYVSVPLTENQDRQVFWFKLGMDQDNYPGFVQLGEEDGYDGDLQTTVSELNWSQEKKSTLNFPHIQKAGHGTVLTLYGDDRRGHENTADNGALFQVRSVSRIDRYKNDYTLLSYINKRFWSLDAEVLVNLGEETKAAQGAAHFLKSASQTGTVQLQMPDGAPVTAYWYVLNTRTSKDVTSKHNKAWARSGHVAFKYKNELYWDTLASFKQNKKILNNWGIFEGQDVVAIYVDLDTLDEKAQKKLFSNESRTDLYYAQAALDPGKTELGDQFVDLINAEDPSVKKLVEFMDGERVPDMEDKQSDEELKRLLKDLSLYAPLTKQIRHDKNGSLIASEKSADEEVRPEHGDDKKAITRAARASVTPKGSQSNGAEEWHNELPRFQWSDEADPAQSVSYSRAAITCYSQCSRVQFMLDRTMHRVRKAASLPDGIIREVSERHVKSALKAQVIGYLYTVNAYAKSQRKSFHLLEREMCSEEILEGQMVLNASVQDMVTRAIKKELVNGNS